ncbi:MAG: hypothetical protein JXR37_00405 [Kiritimatiellae bacterium]|nr:hypothetical protein [Kiritimatiellia bacterium]
MRKALTMACLQLGLCLGAEAQSVFVSFDELPATPPDGVPGSGGAWLYTTATINPDPAYVMTTSDWAGWRSTNAYPAPNPSIRNMLYLYFTTTDNTHMGFGTYGYLEIDATNTVSGHSLRYVVTGGVNPAGTNGWKVTTRAQYTNSVAWGENPIAHGVTVGHPYLYFANTSSQSSPVAFPEAQGANRLSLYYHAPASLNNGPGGYGNRPVPTVHVGPYEGTGGHWYHEICTQGGGWTRVICDGHPQHNNAWSSEEDYPYPNRSLRDMGMAYTTNWYRWYITFIPYSGIATAPYAAWFDEVEFTYDAEPQNNETICSPSVVYFPAAQTFELGFMDKYKNFAYSYSTYEIRYAFAPISNSNWSNATPVHILADPRFEISARTDGRFQKYWPYYQSVWAPFELADTNDTALLTPGTTIHFAVKDISQIGGDSQDPITNCAIGRWPTGGRDYATYPSDFDYAGDQPALPLIKRIAYRIPCEVTDSDADGLHDWWEALCFGDVAGPTGTGDEDGDLLDNLGEQQAHTHPQLTNTDYDAQTDWQEVYAGTDPCAATSYFAIAEAAADPGSGDFVLAWPSTTGRVYEVSATTNLAAGPWETNLWQGAGTGGLLTHTNNDGAAYKCFRVEIR